MVLIGFLFISIIPDVPNSPVTLHKAAALSPYVQQVSFTYSNAAYGGIGLIITNVQPGDDIVVAGLVTLRSGSPAAIQIRQTAGPTLTCQNPINNDDPVGDNLLAVFICINTQGSTNNYNFTVCTACSNIPPGSCSSISCGNWLINEFELPGNSMKFWNSSGTNSGGPATTGTSNSVAFSQPAAGLGFSTTSSNTITAGASGGFSTVTCAQSQTSNVFYGCSEVNTFGSSGTATFSFGYLGSTRYSVEGILYSFVGSFSESVSYALGTLGTPYPAAPTFNYVFNSVNQQVSIALYPAVTMITVDPNSAWSAPSQLTDASGRIWKANVASGTFTSAGSLVITYSYNDQAQTAQALINQGIAYVRWLIPSLTVIFLILIAGKKAGISTAFLLILEMFAFVIVGIVGTMLIGVFVPLWLGVLGAIFCFIGAYFTRDDQSSI